MAHPHMRRAAGFTLVELILSIVLSTLITLGVISFFGTLTQTTLRPVITYNGQNYALAPILSNNQDNVHSSDLLSAMALQNQFSQAVASADFVAVFGGTNVDAGAPAALQPLLTTFTNLTLPSLAAASPASVTSTQLLATAAASDFAGTFDPCTGATASKYSKAFTVLAIQGINQIVAIAQVRQYTTTYSGKTVDLYATTLLSRTLPATTWTGYAYYFWLPAAEDIWSVNVGASHYWYRYETAGWGRQ